MKELIESIENKTKFNSNVVISKGEAKTILQALTSVKSEGAEEFEEALDKQLDALPYTKHLDDGQYNDGQVAGFERGARWCNDFANADKKQHAIGLMKHHRKINGYFKWIDETYEHLYNEYLNTLNNK